MNQPSNLTRNTLSLLSLALIFSLIIGFVNYNYISVKSTPASFSTSVMMYLPDKSQENTFILSNKSPKEWASLADVQAETNTTLIQSPDAKKQESFSVKYNPDLSAFLRNYFLSFAVMNRVSAGFDKKFDANTPVANYGANPLGNGFLILDASTSTKDQANKFATSVTNEFTGFINDLNLTKPEGQKYSLVQPKVTVVENTPTQTKSIIQFISAALVTFAILLYVILAIRNKALSVIVK